jgi:hypothetical protein
MNIEDVEASMVRYLYENLQIPYGIKVYEDLIDQDFGAYDQWVVVDTLTNSGGYQPIQHYFIHAAVKNKGAGQKQELNVLTDRVNSVLSLGTTITLYSYSSGQQLGYMTVSEINLSPVMQHSSGGAYRPLAVSIVYQN